jgi:hypothetical protein
MEILLYIQEWNITFAYLIYWNNIFVLEKCPVPSYSIPQLEDYDWIRTKSDDVQAHDNEIHSN